MRCRLLLFMTIASIVVNLIVWFMPKRLTLKEMYCTWLLMVFLTRTSYQLLDLVLHLYDQLGPGIQWQAVVIQTIFSGAVGILILNFMPKNKLKFFAYTNGCMLLAVVFEWITIRVDYLTYNNWSLWYSAVVYILGIIFLRCHFSFLRRNIKDVIKKG
ncbi:hypothetical protein [Metabacillus idriensis]|uniref:hypothetical protein n=1 Tax=Metabacillus idriensis TaxID=324768 RepID=UPI00174C1F0F|nr:hypothetical protein [Metabacillus idriensis]